MPESESLLNFGFAVLGIAICALVTVCAILYRLLHKTITARDELLAINRDMETTIQAKSEFLVVMSHEIHAPMNALASFCDILVQRVSRDGTPELKEEAEGIIAIIKKSSQDLIDITNDVFDYIRIDANLLEIKSVPMSIQQIIHDVCAIEKPKAAAKNLDMIIKYNGDIPETILSDPVRIQQILSNLVSNAVKFTEKGTVTILCEAFDNDNPANVKTTDGEPRDSSPAPSVHLKISVIDTGIGISPAKKRELFKPFRHADSAIRQQGKRGTGLGLSIAMRLAILLDGTIDIESVPGRGSTFSLLLSVYVLLEDSRTLLEQGAIETPRSSQLHKGLDIRVPVRSTAATSDQRGSLQDTRILVVEDMAVNQIILATLLRDAGAKVELANNGALCVQKVTKDMDNGLVFDVILMDMQMPVMNGYEATDYLRTHGYDRPIIAVTAHTLEGDKEKAIKAGCNDYITKPIDHKTLIAMIKQYVT